MKKSLPVEAFQNEIEELIKNNTVIILTAETGAGKSTMVPFWMWKKGFSVVVTQPRRIAARSLATYLAKKNKIELGSKIGYQTGFERRMSKETSLLFVTDGVQMVKEVKGGKSYDILIIDEIHEWNLNQEVLIGLVKKKINSGFFKKNKKKIVIMSATLQAKQLSHFLNDAPIIEIPGRGYPVTMHNHHKDFMLSDCVEMVKTNRNALVFQPGKKEISDFIEMLKESLRIDKLKAKILPLHSEISSKEQGEVFNHFKVPKIVIATDIAQTSITIDDIDSVIDSGFKKEVRTQRGVEGLFLTEISESECKQRAGRAGRVKSGQYLLCSELDIRDRISFPEPEIRRLNLESVILRLIKWKISPLGFTFFHSPKKNLIMRAISRLKIFGAIDNNEQITEDGKIMAELPVSIRSSRMMIEAREGGKKVLEEILKVIAILEVKGIGSQDFTGEKIYEEELRSDLLNHLALWNSPKLQKKLVNYKKLFLAKEIFKELKKRIKIDEITNKKNKSDKTDMDVLLRSIISAFPDYVYKKAVDSTYVLGEDENERQLDNRSILNNDKPDMLIGLPFDLTINWENRETGEAEKKTLALLSFTTEISLKQLDRLNPFSYKRHSEPYIKDNLLLIKDTLFFGGVIISVYDRDPDWNDKKYKKKIIGIVYDWLRKNISNLKLLEAKYKKIEEDFIRCELVLKENKNKLKSFSVYWQEYIKRIIGEGLKTNDLNMFFSFSAIFANLSIKDVIPKWIIKQLIIKKHPDNIHLGNQNIKIIYNNGIPLAKLSFEQFELMNKDDMVLFSGASLCLQLQNKKYNKWEDALLYYNKWKRADVFKKKWEKNKKEIKVMEDVVDIPFPHAFEGGYGLNKEKFIFFAVPEIVGKKGYLIHFNDEQKAIDNFEKTRAIWEQYLRDYKNSKIEDIFKGKGWKIKT